MKSSKKNLLLYKKEMSLPNEFKSTLTWQDNTKMQLQKLMELVMIYESIICKIRLKSLDQWTEVLQSKREHLQLIYISLHIIHLVVDQNRETLTKTLIKRNFI